MRIAMPKSAISSANCSNKIITCKRRSRPRCRSAGCGTISSRSTRPISSSSRAISTSSPRSTATTSAICSSTATMTRPPSRRRSRFTTATCSASRPTSSWPRTSCTTNTTSRRTTPTRSATPNRPGSPTRPHPKPSGAARSSPTSSMGSWTRRLPARPSTASRSVTPRSCAKARKKTTWTCWRFISAR